MERIKEELACLRVLFTLSVAIDVTLLGWLAQNYYVAHWPILMVAAIIAGTLTIVAMVVVHAILRRLPKMEKQQ